jgi:L-2-hydroxyglutarate oxidase LhgO
MAHTCVRGAELMYKYCEEHKLPAERVGKIIVAINEQEHPVIEELYRRGTANGVKGLEIIYKERVSPFPFVESLQFLLSSSLSPIMSCQ